MHAQVRYGLRLRTSLGVTGRRVIMQSRPYPLDPESWLSELRTDHELYAGRRSLLNPKEYLDLYQDVLTFVLKAVGYSLGAQQFEYTGNPKLKKLSLPQSVPGPDFQTREYPG